MKGKTVKMACGGAFCKRPCFAFRFAVFYNVKGRLKFGGCKDAAPFPSMVVIFGKEREHEETEHAGRRGTGKEEA